jgi:hypothetical protein
MMVMEKVKKVSLCSPGWPQTGDPSSPYAEITAVDHSAHFRRRSFKNVKHSQIILNFCNSLNLAL